MSSEIMQGEVSLEEKVAAIQAELSTLKAQVRVAKAHTGEPWKWSDVEDFNTVNNLAIPDEWHAYAFGDGDAPALQMPQVAATIKALLCRLQWCENQRRVDRDRIYELEKDHDQYQTQLKEVVESAKKAVKEGWPLVTDVVVIDPTCGPPRKMNGWEKSRLVAILSKLTDTSDKELLETVQRVMGVPAVKETLQINVDECTDDQLWKLYYHCLNFDAKNPGSSRTAKSRKLERTIGNRKAKAVAVTPMSSTACDDTPIDSTAEDDDLFGGF
jgi:hypothetical protein